VAPPGVPSTLLPLWLRQSQAFRHEASRSRTYKLLKTPNQREWMVLTFFLIDSPSQTVGHPCSAIHFLATAGTTWPSFFPPFPPL
jgi:hypothetical protein